ncbi:MAG: cellulose synthase family protein [Bacteroidota bacterium]
MTTIAFVILGIYTLALAYITIYCVMQFNLLYHYKRTRTPGEKVKALLKEAEQEQEKPQLSSVEDGTSAGRSLAHASATSPVLEQPDSKKGQGQHHATDYEKEFPFVTVQLPIYNEYFVIGRLIDAVCLFDWPKDRFEIHILDDSTDETVEVVAEKVAEYQAKGFQIEQIRREKRQGFKAGALRDGMSSAKGDFMAIFDADFVPEPDFLKRTMPHFRDPEIGVVQTRWEHINQDYSLITKLQAIQLNVHFTVEQKGREKGGHLLQFNGTAGIWRRAAIEAGGGWEADTITEDLDLSIRAQLAGYRITFLEEVGSPSELPVEMNSFKSQQHRWMKGGAETARKMLPQVWGSDLPLAKKIYATNHLLASTIFVFVFICGVFSVPLLYFLGDLIDYGISKNFFAVFLVGLLSIIAIYYVANVQSPANREQSFGRSVFKFLVLFPLFLALSMGLSLHNTVAVIQGWLGKKSPFVRTPKFNIKNTAKQLKTGKYLTGKLNLITLGEGVLCLYFLAAVVGAFVLQNTTFIVFHLLLALGYGTIFFYSLKHLRYSR